MILKTKLLGHVYQFKSVKDALAKANEEKSGDRLAGIAAENAEERVAAKVVVANLTLADLRNHPAVPYEEDEVTRIIQDDVNEKIYDQIKNWTVAELREWLLAENHDGDAIRMAQRLARELGLGVGISSGANFLGAVLLQERYGHLNTVTLFPDDNKKYLTTDYGTEEPELEGYLSPEIELLDVAAVRGR